MYVYHGCRNRACPACHAAQTQQWLADRQEELLPCPYFHLTATVPQGLRDLFRSNQKVLYDLLMSLTARCVMDVAANPKHLGAAAGHPCRAAHLDRHADLSPPCALPGHRRRSVAGRQGLDRHPAGVLPSRPRALPASAPALQADAAKQKHPELFAKVPAKVWQQEWVVHCVPWGRNEHGVLDYLARYVFRIAITERRILAMDDQSVTFQYKDRKADRQRTCRLEGIEFVRRYLQHVLPKGFHKVRYYGLWNPRRREQLEQVRLMLQLQRPPRTPCPGAGQKRPLPFKPFHPVCPCCGGELAHRRRDSLALAAADRSPSTPPHTHRHRPPRRSLLKRIAVLPCAKPANRPSIHCRKNPSLRTGNRLRRTALGVRPALPRPPRRSAVQSNRVFTAEYRPENS